MNRAETLCQERVCQGLSWICGAEAGRFEWFAQAAPCDDGNACTARDTCTRGRCTGAPLACTAVPANACVDDQRLKVYGAGTCDGNSGGCAYASREVVCPEGCAAGRCSGDPCFGITCELPPGPCWATRGACDPATGRCVYAPLPEGTSCIVAEACLLAARCDGAGTCVAGAPACTRPHAHGGTCAQGACQGFACDLGFGNCNADWADGCEVDLTRDPVSCGACGATCPDGPHAASGCLAGKCALQCEPPFQDCNADPADGCEIPVGLANHCSRAGLVPFDAGVGATPGCGTPYCGPGGVGAQSFGTWHCVFCDHCEIFADGGAWCLEEMGLFSKARCTSCCPPGDPAFPSVCGQ
jgi:hypothetical protein